MKQSTNNPRVSRPPASTVARLQDPATPHTRVKICGLTSVGDAVAACNAGVDALGLVFYPPSSRHIEVSQAEEIMAALPPFVTVTGLFLNAEKSLIDKMLERLPLSLLQFHGTESPEFCESFGRPYIKSVGMKTESDVPAYARQYTRSRGFLLDSNVSGGAGGSGEIFDWSLIPQDLSAPLILAGGLDTGNVDQAVMRVRPAAVDVSSGVESSKGVKDHALMRDFISKVRAADDAIFQQLISGSSN